jgi:hypothetical protein
MRHSGSVLFPSPSWPALCGPSIKTAESLDATWITRTFAKRLGRVMTSEGTALDEESGLQRVSSVGITSLMVRCGMDFGCSSGAEIL